MELPDLPPDLTFARLGSDPADIDFAFDVKRAALGPYIRERWGWDEGLQRDLHARHFSEKPFLAIRRSGQRLGTLSFQQKPDHLRFGEFYLFPQHQGRGTGRAILAHCLAVADSMKVPVRLEHLHWNPVGSLYRRMGFQDIGRSDTHCFMQRQVSGH